MFLVSTFIAAVWEGVGRGSFDGIGFFAMSAAFSEVFAEVIEDAVPR
jgi:hypothetical protein